MLVISKIFFQFVEKIDELKPSLSKQHNKMLNIRSKKLKIEKKGKIIKLVENSRKVSREFSESRESRGFSGF